MPFFGNPLCQCSFLLLFGVLSSGTMLLLLCDYCDYVTFNSPYRPQLYIVCFLSMFPFDIIEMTE